MESQFLHKVRELHSALERSTGELGDLTSSLQHIAQTAQKFFAADTCDIFAINPITNQFVASQFIALNMSKTKPSKQLEELAQQVLRRGIVVVEDLETTSEYHDAFKRVDGIRSFVALVLDMKHQQKPLGVLYLNFKQQRKFTSHDYELFRIFSERASLILKETWLLQRYQKVVRIGYEINQELETVEILFQKLQQNVADILDIGHAFLLAIYQSQTNTLDVYLKEETNFINRTGIPVQGAYQHVIETQKTLFIQHWTKEAKHLPFQIEDLPGTQPKESFIFVPLVLREASLGVLSIQHPLPNAYNQEDLFILHLLANHIALARHNIRLFDRLNRLNEVGRLLTQQLDSEDTLQAIVDRICEATRSDIVVLYPYIATQKRFILPPCLSGKLQASPSDLLSLNQLDDIAALMLHHEKPLFAKNNAMIYTHLHSNTHIHRGSFGERENIRSTAALPLRVGSEPVGVLFINFRQSQRFDATQKLFIEGLAHYAAIAIKNAEVFVKLRQRRLRELEILQNIDRELNRTLNLASLLNIILKLAHEHIPAEEASILLYNSQNQALEIQAAVGPHAEARQMRIIPLHENKYITHWVLEHKKVARADNVHRDPQWRELYIEAAPDIVSELDVPLLDGEEVIGVLNFESTKEAAFSQQDEDFLITLAGQAVLAIKNAQAYEQSKREAQRFALWYRAEQELDKLNDMTQLEQAYDIILHIAVEHSQSQVVIHRYDVDSKELIVVRNSESQFPLFPRQSLDIGIDGQVARERLTLVVHDAHNPPFDIVPAHLLDPTIRSLLITPIMFKDQYYGNLGLRHEDIGYFWGADITFFEGLAQQLATTIYRLETTQEHQEFEHRISSLEIMSSIGQVAFELTHRWGNDLGLVAAYVDDIRLGLEAQAVSNITVAKKLDNIVRVTQKVLDLSKGLKQALGTTGEPVIVPPKILLEETQIQALPSLPANIQIELAIYDEVATIEVIYSQVADILRNLVTNAIEAMPKGGVITLSVRNVGRFVALEVNDTGIGIPLHQQSKIFELSFSTKGSSGFGLWSARINALKNRGDLKVQSEVGRGTTFTLLLPRLEKGLS